MHGEKEQKRPPVGRTRSQRCWGRSTHPKAAGRVQGTGWWVAWVLQGPPAGLTHVVAFWGLGAHAVATVYQAQALTAGSQQPPVDTAILPSSRQQKAGPACHSHEGWTRNSSNNAAALVVCGLLLSQEIRGCHWFLGTGGTYPEPSQALCCSPRWPTPCLAHLHGQVWPGPHPGKGHGGCQDEKGCVCPAKSASVPRPGPQHKTAPKHFITQAEPGHRQAVIRKRRTHRKVKNPSPVTRRPKGRALGMELTGTQKGQLLRKAQGASVCFCCPRMG